MKKRQLLKMAFAVIFLAVLASCKKDDANLLPVTDKGVTEIKSASHNENEKLRGIDPSGTLNSLALQYGNTYDFSNLFSTVAVTTNKPTVYLYVAKLIWDDNQWISIVINNSAQVIGLYEFEYYYLKSDMNSNDEIEERSNYYYYINDIDNATTRLFSGSILADVFGVPDYLYVFSNDLPLPSDYSYPLFDNVAAGTYSLGTTGTITSNDSPSQKAIIALRAASTFYNNFY